MKIKNIKKIIIADNDSMHNQILSNIIKDIKNDIDIILCSYNEELVKKLNENVDILFIDIFKDNKFNNKILYDIFEHNNEIRDKTIIITGFSKSIKYIDEKIKNILIINKPIKKADIIDVLNGNYNVKL